MKFYVVALSIGLSALSFAAPQKLESLLVKEVHQSGNLMPGPGPARPIQSQIQVEVMSNGCTNAADFKINVMTARSGD